jgi:2-oxoglutarate dehydrogenase E2 component (dihydrolipoamide succinyltransferase)
LKKSDDVVAPGEVIGYIDDSAQPSATTPLSAQPEAVAEAEAEAAPLQQPEPEVKPADNNERVAVEEPVEAAPDIVAPASRPAPMLSGEGRHQERVPMTRLRRRIAERLKSAQNTAAMLTTFNEVNLQAVMDLRSRYGAAFQEKHGVKLGFMSFFVQAVCHAASKYPALNAYIEGDEIVYHDYVDVGIAVSSDKGLVVPVLRNAHRLSLAEIEKGILNLSGRVRSGGLSPDDLKGGTFSITNGGIFGSMLSTPILNPPQSGILGMHNIMKRPVVENDTIVIRPMMYLALSYDHRLIDGADAVSVKEALEFPASLNLDI